MDQARTLRKMMNNRVALHPATMRPVRVISVTSGKGGVGKTNVVANLAIYLQKQGHRVLVLDGDFGLANLNIVMGLEAKNTVFDIISGNKNVKEVILEGPHGVKILPASSGVFKMTQLSSSEKSVFIQSLETSDIDFDILLIDTGAGLNSDVAYLNAVATEVLVVTTPEPTSITDAYAMMKVMSCEYNVKRFKLVVNMADRPSEALGVYHHLMNVSDRFLNIQIEYLGHILRDPKVSQAVISRKVLCDAWPESNAAKCIEIISKVLSEVPVRMEMTGNLQLFWRTLLSEVRV